MCGIWALLGYDQSISSELHHALEIAHRGPDFFRIESIPNYQHVLFGFHRLSIMDDLTGQQPMQLFDLPHIHMMYNGEIYNHKLLIEKYSFKCSTRMDGEVIIHLYNKFGIEKTLQLLDGVFAVAIFDTSNGTFHIGRDTFGVRPLFTARPANGKLGICSEAKGLAKVSEYKDSSVKIMPFKPGTYASFSVCETTGVTKLLKEGPFTDVDVEPVFDYQVKLGDDIKENIRNLFTNAVRKRLMAERRIGCLLSGGLDSSLVASLVVKLAREQGFQYPIQTFSIGLPGSPDLVKAKKVADMLGTEHHEILFSAEEAFTNIEKVIYTTECYDTITMRGCFPMYMMCKYIRENTDTVVLFAGEGSDELTQGYIYFHKAPNAEEAHEESKRLLREIYLYDSLRADRPVAAHGIEVRLPFLDKAFCYYFLSLPKDLVQPQKGIEKYLLRSAFDGYLDDLLPSDVLWRPKEGFSDGVAPLENSWRLQLQNHASTKISNDELKQAGNLFPVNSPATHEAFYYRKIFDRFFPGQEQLTPYLWMPKWIDNVSDPSARVLNHYKQQQ